MARERGRNDSEPAEGGDMYSLLVKAEKAAGTGSFERDLETGKGQFSPGLRRIFGLPAGRRATRKALLERIDPGDRPLLEPAIQQAVETRQPLSLDLRIIRPDDTRRTVRIHGSVLLNKSGQPDRLVGMVRDVTDEVEAHAARELLSLVVESSDDAILTKAQDGTITSWNRGAERLYRWTAAEAVGQPISIIEPPEIAGEQDAIVQRVFSGESLEHFETQRIRKDGQRIFVSLTISPVRDAAGRIISAAVVARDTTDRRKYEERLRYLADHDQLTGLFNRRRFEEELRREFARAGRYASTGALISVDIDNFKAINDSCGHAAGDVVLTSVAKTMTQRFRATDVVARLGGDEFAVLLTNVSIQQARSAAEDLLGALRAARPLFGGKALHIGASVGVTTFEPDEMSADELQIFADLAMYSAKHAGGDRIRVFTAEEGRRARNLVRQPWADRIREALNRDRFVLHLQPILDLSTGKISHGELLLRMRDRNNKLILPDRFLPTAERAGLIRQIDEWVIRHAIGLIADSERPLAAGGLGVNVSGASVAGDAPLLELIERELTQTGVNPSQLIFEVTETAAIGNMPEATRFATDLTRLGCSLALDDFGTGFSSFYYLKHLPVRYIKLDGEFIQNLPHSKVDEHVVRAIADVARSMEIKTVAESVADEATIKMLRKHEVDYAQGFHIGRPVPIASSRTGRRREHGTKRAAVVRPITGRGGTQLRQVT